MNFLVWLELRGLLTRRAGRHGLPEQSRSRAETAALYLSRNVHKHYFVYYWARISRFCQNDSLQVRSMIDKKVFLLVAPYFAFNVAGNFGAWYFRDLVIFVISLFLSSMICGLLYSFKVDSNNKIGAIFSAVILMSIFATNSIIALILNNDEIITEMKFLVGSFVLQCGLIVFFFFDKLPRPRKR